jgi:polyether ionophore transport system permease protein
MLTKDDFAGTTAMIRLILWRDKIIIALFILFMVLLVVFVASSFINLYSDEALRMAFYLQMKNNPTVVSLLGSVLDPSLGALTAWRIGFGASLIMGIFSVFLMVRHTRSEERKGRLELINSAKVGRQAVLSAALITTLGVNLIIAILIGLGLTGLGFDAYSSLVLGMSLGAFGCLFTSITGVAVQLTESSGDARYLMAGLLVAFFILRVFGWDDGDYVWVSWLSPYGWVHHIGPFAENETWIFGIFLIFTAAFCTLAYWLSSLRDLGAGIITQRSGPARASKSLRSSLALAWRLHRGMLSFWIIIFVLMGLMLGFTAHTVTNIITNNPQFVNLIIQLGGNAGLTDSYFTMMLAFLVELFAFYAILATLKLHSQESNKYSEMVLTSSVSRSQWAVSNLIFAVLAPALVLIIFALTMGLSYGLISGNLSEDMLRILGAALVYLPAVWLFTGISMLLFGLIPRMASLSWVALALVVVIDLLGEFFDINQWILNFSPFTHVPRLLAGESVSGSLILLFVVAMALIFAGICGYQLRDVNG